MKIQIAEITCPGCNEQLKSVLPIPVGFITCDHCGMQQPTPKDFFDDTLGRDQVIELKMRQWALVLERRAARR
jgi:Zn ribbon nucleic-acid-binding protein